MVLAAWTFAEMTQEPRPCSPDKALFPDGFEAPCDWKDVKAKTKVELQDAAIKDIEDRVQRCETVVWDPLLVEAMTHWWEAHMSRTGALWAASLHGVPYSSTETKQALVKVLLKYQCPALPMGQMEEYAGLWGSLPEWGIPAE